MILKAFKEKSIKKKLNTILNYERSLSDEGVIKRVGIIFNGDEIDDFEMFKSLSEDLRIHPNRLKIIGFTENKKDNVFSWNASFNPKDIGWQGKINNVELETFLDSDFDLLISFYTTDILELKLLTALSKAKFKASIFQDRSLTKIIL